LAKHFSDLPAIASGDYVLPPPNARLPFDDPQEVRVIVNNISYSSEHGLTLYVNGHADRQIFIRLSHDAPQPITIRYQHGSNQGTLDATLWVGEHYRGTLDENLQPGDQAVLR